MTLVRPPRSKRVDWALALERPTLDEPAVRVDSIMSKDVATCRENDPAIVPAQIMWDKDCGCVPVVDDDGHPLGMVTDRDLCMAAFTQGKALREIPVSRARSRVLHTCRWDDLVSDATRIMARAQVRRLLVLGTDGRLVGLLTLSDLIRHAWTARTRLDADSDALLPSLLLAVSSPRPSMRGGTLSPMDSDERERLAEYDSP